MTAREHSFSPTVLRPVPARDEPSRWQSTIDHVISALTRVRSCWHREMSRPFTRDGRTYRACLRCGARRDFDLETWQMKGPFYADGRVVRPLSLSQASVNTTAARSGPDRIRLVAGSGSH